MIDDKNNGNGAKQRSLIYYVIFASVIIMLLNALVFPSLLQAQVTEVSYSKFLEMVDRYTEFPELTPQMINEFVDKIVVHAPEKIDGDRTQKVEIFLKYVGKFELPAPEPTAEDLALEEKRRKTREKNRRKYERRKAKQQAEQ